MKRLLHLTILAFVLLAIALPVTAFSFKGLFFGNEVTMNNDTGVTPQADLEVEPENTSEGPVLSPQVENQIPTLVEKKPLKTVDVHVENTGDLRKKEISLEKSIIQFNPVTLAKYEGSALINHNAYNDPVCHKYGDDYLVSLNFISYINYGTKFSAEMELATADKTDFDALRDVETLTFRFGTQTEALDWFKMMREFVRNDEDFYLLFTTSDCKKGKYAYDCTVDMDAPDTELKTEYSFDYQHDLGY